MSTEIYLCTVDFLTGYNFHMTMLIFASASNDGTVKLWETEKLEGNSVANRSKQTLVRKNTSLPGRVYTIYFSNETFIIEYVL